MNTKGQWGCSITAKTFTVTRVIYTITDHCEFTAFSYYLG